MPEKRQASACRRQEAIGPAAHARTSSGSSDDSPEKICRSGASGCGLGADDIARLLRPSMTATRCARRGGLPCRTVRHGRRAAAARRVGNLPRGRVPADAHPGRSRPFHYAQCHASRIGPLCAMTVRIPTAARRPTGVRTHPRVSALGPRVFRRPAPSPGPLAGPTTRASVPSAPTRPTGDTGSFLLRRVPSDGRRGCGLARAVRGGVGGVMTDIV